MGVYVFTHLESGSKYVGFSNNLSYRLFNYIRHEDSSTNNSGLMLPIFREQGIKAFNLEIFIMPTVFSNCPLDPAELGWLHRFKCESVW